MIYGGRRKTIESLLLEKDDDGIGEKFVVHYFKFIKKRHGPFCLIYCVKERVGFRTRRSRSRRKSR